MSFFLAMLRQVFDNLPWAIVLYSPFSLAVAAFLTTRRRRVERHILGRCRAPFWRELANDAVSGVIAGFFGSLLLLFLGITIDTEGFAYVLLLAVFLVFLDPRYICLAYAGGILSLLSLAAGLPKLHIPGLMALVAVLHIIESALIMTGGDRHALPVYLRSRRDTIGGYLLQRIWPVPLLVFTFSTDPGNVTSLSTPAWWPLIPLALPAGAVLAILPAAAALGYGDLAITSPPRVKAVRTGALLLAYSVILLALAAISVKMAAFAWAAAIFALLGHELVLYVAHRAELRGKPYFSPGREGIRILAVLPGTPAARAGLKPGDAITGVNGQKVASKAEFLKLLGESSSSTNLTIAPIKNDPERRYDLDGDASFLGIIPAPDPDDQAQADVHPWRFLPRRRKMWR